MHEKVSYNKCGRKQVEEKKSRLQECVKNWCQTEYGVEYDEVIIEKLSKMSNTCIFIH